MDNHSDFTYKIFRKTEDGQDVFVAGRAALEEAKQLIASMTEYWPGDYSIECGGSLSGAGPSPKPSFTSDLHPYH